MNLTIKSHFQSKTNDEVLLIILLIFIKHWCLSYGGGLQSQSFRYLNVLKKTFSENFHIWAIAWDTIFLLIKYLKLAKLNWEVSFLFAYVWSLSP